MNNPTTPKEKNVWMTYPRPQLKREKYHMLNGEWTLNEHPVTVPFAPQSALSGYTGEITDKLLYKRTFTIPIHFTNHRIILHFGAVDQIAHIKINHRTVGSNEGGYIPFSFDITEYTDREKENLLEVYVTDALSLDYPYGKQSKNPKGMWYTAVSGIWQSVWLENVPDTYIQSLTVKSDLDNIFIKLTCNKPVTHYQVKIFLPDNNELTKTFSSAEMQIPIPNPIHWTPEHPHLYHMEITAGEDLVKSYFALRTINIQSINGVNRVCLNNKPIFLHGVLEQGYFYDGIFLPEKEQEYEHDIKRMKELGFNLLRKHIKIEPEYFYYACDKLGMLIMQDMVNSGSYSFFRDTLIPTLGFKRKKDEKLSKNHKRRQIFEKQTKLTIEHLYNHPCVVAYTIFNEGWGQFNSDEMYDFVKKLDDSRLVDSTSGWFTQQKSDFDSEHIYFRLKKLNVNNRPLLVSECGGYKLLYKDHFFGKQQYGYGTCRDSMDLTNKIRLMYDKMIVPAIRNGLCGCIYTQLSDVEDEINGLYTYDRKVCKVHKETLLEISDKLFTTLNE